LFNMQLEVKGYIVTKKTIIDLMLVNNHHKPGKSDLDREIRGRDAEWMIRDNESHGGCKVLLSVDGGSSSYGKWLSEALKRTIWICLRTL